jgi:regulator of RNase E activity RraB
MSDQWDFYFANVNDKLASLFLDVGIRERVPDPSRPWLLWVWVYFQSPRDDGLSDAGESKVLADIEDAITETISSSLDGVFVGRITTDGRREFYSYATDFVGFEDAIAGCMSKFPSYQWDSGSLQDPNWSQYLDVLYPTPRDWQRIQNRHVIEHLQSLGDRLQKKRLVSHWAYFPDEATRGRFVAGIEDLGFSILQQQVDSDSQAVNPMSVSFERLDDVDWDSINQVTLELFELADSCSGQYDGWETSVEKDD